MKLPPDEGDMRLIIHSLYDIMHVLDEFYLVLLDLPQSYDIVDIFRELRSEISLVCNGIILAYMFMTSYPNEYRLMPAALDSDTQQFKKFAYVGRTYAGSASTQLGKTIPKDFSEGAQRFGEGMERLDLLLQSRGLDGTYCIHLLLSNNGELDDSLLRRCTFQRCHDPESREDLAFFRCHFSGMPEACWVLSNSQAALHRP